MNNPRAASGASRIQRIATTAVLSLAAVVGFTAIHQRIWIQMLGFLCAFAAFPIQAVQAVGREWTRAVRLVAMLISGTILAAALGLLARMVLHGVQVDFGWFV
jgi:hypothetical protein